MAFENKFNAKMMYDQGGNWIKIQYGNMELNRCGSTN
jgi:hypothetical protein